MFKITVIKNLKKYSERYELEEECLSWRDKNYPDAPYTIDDVTWEFFIPELEKEVEKYMESQIDAKSRTSIELMIKDESISKERKNKISMVESYRKRGTDYFEKVKAELLKNPTTTWDCSVNIGLCPVTIWDIAGTP